MRLPLALLALVLVTGCSVDTGAPARTAERFHEAVAERRDDTACALLSPRAAEKLPDPGQTCAEALRALELEAGGPITSVQVWGDAAQVRMAGDTVFLHRFSDGWRVKAAGCEPQGDLPYDCEVEG
ncbi:hypothetical protein AB0C18_04560 [Nonomuraea muscovyensis]|uniref:hypothetical protein n=1 Tax=Nonomuraea muscovyensis TaxID=1124761 RepID=UPI00340F5BA2